MNVVALSCLVSVNSAISNKKNPINMEEIIHLDV